MKNSCICIILFISGICFGGTRDPSISDSKYIEYGSKFNNVVQIYGEENDGSLFFGSAVTIDDHHVITAAHIVHQAKKCTVKLLKKEYHLSKIICHKDFEHNKFGTCDIAIGYTDHSFGLDFYPALYDKQDELTKVCSISGFGLTGTFDTGAVTSDNLRRAGSNIVHKIENDLLMCDPSFIQKRTELEFLIASGDSGGGLFIEGKLAGINSCVMTDIGRKPNSDYFCESGHTRVSNFIDWISENLQKKH